MASRELGGGKKKHSNGLRINSFRRREPEHITDDKRWKYGRGNRKWCHGERPIVGGLGRRHNRAGGGTSTGMGDTAAGRWHKLVFCWRWRHRNRSPFGGTTATVCGCSSEAPSEWPSSSSFRQWYWPPFTVSAHTLWRETTKLVSTKVQLLHHCTLKKKKKGLIRFPNLHPLVLLFVFIIGRRNLEVQSESSDWQQREPIRGGRGRRVRVESGGA